jgi:hypothetical protein
VRHVDLEHRGGLGAADLGLGGERDHPRGFEHGAEP